MGADPHDDVAISKKGCGVRLQRILNLLAMTAVAWSLSGCGRSDRHYVTGTVRYPDGSPVVDGKIIVNYGEGARLQAGAYIKKDGSFRIGEIKDGDGM
jgi:hypothetical protein